MEACSPLISRVYRALWPRGVARGLEGGQGAVGEARQKEAGVVDGDGLRFSGEEVLAALNKCLRGGGDFGDAAVQPHGGIDAVGQQIAGDAAAGHGGVETPEAV